MKEADRGLLFIDGQLREAAEGARFDVVNPADESVVGSMADATVKDVFVAVTAARGAFDTTSWSTDHKSRRRCLEQLQAALRQEVTAFQTMQIKESGLCASVGGLIPIAIEEMSYAINLVETFQWEAEFPPHELWGMRSLRRVRHEPYGVVGAITAWNAPFMLNLWKIVPALATGNTVVLKTAPDTPLAGSMLARVVRDETEFPPGVLNIISASNGALAGDALTGDPRIDMFHFTGSTSVGQRIAERAAVGVRKAVLELGGKSANILLPDADLEVAIPHSVGMCMLNSGQGCSLATRMIVHDSVYDEVIERLRSMVSQIPAGDPADPQSVVGPIIRKSQLERIVGLVDRARSAGARVIVGGHRIHREKGFWYAPTVLVDVDENSELAQTEVFGPVLSVLKYGGDDSEAIRIANNTIYGLSAFIQCRDVERARRIADRLRAGTVSINRSTYISPDTPFGGYGASGLGREHGIEGWREFLQTKTIATPAE